MENKLWYLKRFKLFYRAPEETVSHCEHFFTQQLFPKRSHIFDQGDPARMVYLVKSGKVKLVRHTEDGKEILLTVLGPGDLFGEEVVFQEQIERSTIAECLEPSLVCMAKAENVYAMLSRHPVLALNVAKYLLEQRDDALSVVEEVAYLKVPERILRLFDRLAAEHGKPVAGGTLLDLRLTHADIASLVGSTRETVSQQLSLLAKAGRIRMNGKSIVLSLAG
ncbi:MAG: Crp/Fnr family transcriptional regulator [Candidatus Eremiobacteraeota bacterium]|nr:Crp/Fnr family transcriptional regulator [Candidatus Eremiobacteraeota bacterium]